MRCHQLQGRHRVVVAGWSAGTPSGCSCSAIRGRRLRPSHRRGPRGSADARAVRQLRGPFRPCGGALIGRCPGATRSAPSQGSARRARPCRPRLPDRREARLRQCATASSARFDEGAGSIIIVLATDAPLLPTQIKRLVTRTSLGLARIGGMGYNGSGDIFIGFSTANRRGGRRTIAMTVVGLEMLPNDLSQPPDRRLGTRDRRGDPQRDARGGDADGHQRIHGARASAGPTSPRSCRTPTGRTKGRRSPSKQ